MTTNSHLKPHISKIIGDMAPQTHRQAEKSIALQDIFLSYLFTRHAFDLDIEADYLCVHYTGRPEDYPPHLAFPILHLLHLKRPSLPVMIFCQDVDRTHILEICVRFFVFVKSTADNKQYLQYNSKSRNAHVTKLCVLSALE